MKNFKILFSGLILFSFITSCEKDEQLFVNDQNEISEQSPAQGEESVKALKVSVISTRDIPWCSSGRSRWVGTGEGRKFHITAPGKGYIAYNLYCGSWQGPRLCKNSNSPSGMQCKH